MDIEKRARELYDQLHEGRPDKYEAFVDAKDWFFCQRLAMLESIIKEGLSYKIAELEAKIEGEPETEPREVDKFVSGDVFEINGTPYILCLVPPYWNLINANGRVVELLRKKPYLPIADLDGGYGDNWRYLGRCKGFKV